MGLRAGKTAAFIGQRTGASAVNATLLLLVAPWVVAFSASIAWVRSCAFGGELGDQRRVARQSLAIVGPTGSATQMAWDVVGVDARCEGLPDI